MEGKQNQEKKGAREQVEAQRLLGEDHGEEGHSDEETWREGERDEERGQLRQDREEGEGGEEEKKRTLSHLSEVGSPAVEVDLRVDLVDSRQGVHDDGGRLGSRENLVVDDEHVLEGEEERREGQFRARDDTPDKVRDAEKDSP